MNNKNLRDPIKYEIMDEDPDAGVFDVNGDTYLAMREVAWNDGTPKLELRRWYAGHDGKEDFPSKGFSFLTEDGPDALAELLVKRGYGNTEVLSEAISQREAPNDKTNIDKDSMLKMVSG